MKIRKLVVAGATILPVSLVVLSVALICGGPTRPAPMHSISDPFKDVDFSALSPLAHFAARDGAQLAFRRYDPIGTQSDRGSVVLVHGSSADSRSMHPLAQSFADAGFTVFALDIRGHGDSGPHGDIGYVGQLDDDLEDFLQAVHPSRPRTLLGFSAGGGFAIRVAGGPRQALFDNYLLLAPYTNRHALNFRPGGGGWVSVGIPRLIALSLLNRIGITALNHLPTVKFAVAEASASKPSEYRATPWYSYSLSRNFQPQDDYQRNIREIREPVAVLDGQDDEIFIATRFAQVFADAGRPDIPVTLVPHAGHIALTLAPAARAAAISAVERLDANKTPVALDDPRGRP